MQRSVVRAHPALSERVHLEVERRHGNWSTGRDHARLHGVQAAELSDAEVEAELARPRRVQEVLPLVRPSYRAPGDALTATDGQAKPPAAARQPRPANSP